MRSESTESLTASSSIRKDRRRGTVTLCALAAILLLTSCEGNALMDPLQDTEPAGGLHVAISKIAPQQGRLVVDWSPYEGDDFVSYDLYEVSGGRRTLRFATDEASALSWTDSLYVGGSISYELVVRTTGSEVMASQQTYRGKAAAILDVELTDTYRARLRWSPGDYGENVSRFGVTRAREGEEILLTEALEADDTSFVDLSAVFGESYVYRLLTYNSEGSASTSESIPFHVGGIGRPFQYIDYTSATGSYYTLGYNVLRRIDTATHEVMAEYIGSDAPQGWIRHFSLPAEGSAVYIAEGTNIVQLDPLTLESEKTVSLVDLLGYGAIPSQISATSDGTSFVYTYRYESPTYYSDALVLVDVANDELLRHQTYLDGVSSIVWSTDGEHVLMGNNWLDVWRVNENEFVRVASQVASSSFSSSMDGGSRYVTTNDGYISIYNTATQALERQHPIETSLSSPTVDPVSGYLGGYERRGHWYVVYDLVTGHEVDRIEVAANQEFVLANRTLFSTHGRYLPLELE